MMIYSQEKELFSDIPYKDLSREENHKLDDICMWFKRNVINNELTKFNLQKDKDGEVWAVFTSGVLGRKEECVCEIPVAETMPNVNIYADGDIKLNSLRKLPNIKIHTSGNLILNNVTKISSDFYAEVGGDLILSSLKHVSSNFHPIVNKNVNLNKVTSISKRFNPVIGKNLFMNSLPEITKEFNPIVGCKIYLDKVKKVCDNFGLLVGETLILDNLEKVGRNFHPICGLDMYLCKLKKMPADAAPYARYRIYLNPSIQINKAFRPFSNLFYEGKEFIYPKNSKGKGTRDEIDLIKRLQWKNGKYRILYSSLYEVINDHTIDNHYRIFETIPLTEGNCKIYKKEYLAIWDIPEFKYIIGNGLTEEEAIKDLNSRAIGDCYYTYNLNDTVTVDEIIKYWGDLGGPVKTKLLDYQKTKPLTWGKVAEISKELGSDIYYNRINGRN